jgi:hypothetical protein
MDFMEELKSIHKDVLEAKESNDIKDTLWKLTIAMEYLVTAMMEKERQEI